jgi:hypothetical protein
MVLSQGGHLDGLRRICWAMDQGSLGICDCHCCICPASAALAAGLTKGTLHRPCSTALRSSIPLGSAKAEVFNSPLLLCQT